MITFLCRVLIMIIRVSHLLNLEGKVKEVKRTGKNESNPKGDTVMTDGWK